MLDANCELESVAEMMENLSGEIAEIKKTVEKLSADMCTENKSFVQRMSKLQKEVSELLQESDEDGL